MTCRKESWGQGNWWISDTISPVGAIRNFYIGNLTNGFVSSKISLTELERMKKDMSTTRELSSLLTVRSSFHEITSLIQEHKMTGLSPGCTYGVELRTVTGSRQTRLKNRAKKSAFFPDNQSLNVS